MEKTHRRVNHYSTTMVRAGAEKIMSLRSGVVGKGKGHQGCKK